MKTVVNAILITFLFMATSCSSYVNSLHRQFDRETGYQEKQRQHDTFSLYRNPVPSRGRGARPGALTSADRRNVQPMVKRQYRPAEQARKRYRAEDLNDNGDDGSLWAGDGKDSSLFFTDTKKRIGDIIVLKVNTRMKNEITAELKKAFPEPVPRARKKDDKEEEKGKEKEAKTAARPRPAAQPGAGEVTGPPGKVHDKISTVIVEEVNRDHVLIRGRKSLLFHNRKRFIEVQALAARKDIDTEDTISSDSILESSVTVLY